MPAVVPEGGVNTSSTECYFLLFTKREHASTIQNHAVKSC